MQTKPMSGQKWMLLLFIALTSCTQKENTGEITFYEKVVFKLQEEESVRPLKKTIQEEFSTLTDSMSHIPLYRYIDAPTKGYRLFLSMPYGVETDSICHYFSNISPPENHRIDFTDTGKECYYQYEKNHVGMTVYVASILEIKVMMLGVCAPEQLQDSLWHYTNIKKRWNHPKS
jgi:hypothetical protein